MDIARASTSQHLSAVLWNSEGYPDVLYSIINNAFFIVEEGGGICVSKTLLPFCSHILDDKVKRGKKELIVVAYLEELYLTLIKIQGDIF